MSTVTGHEKCLQCDFEFGIREFNCHTNEWYFVCRRCGYSEPQEWIAAEDGSRVGWKHEILDGHGASWAQRPGNGVSVFNGLHSAQDVDHAVQQMRDAIAKGQLDGDSSYVTRWDAEAKHVQVVAGKWLDLSKESPLRKETPHD